MCDITLSDIKISDAFWRSWYKIFKFKNKNVIIVLYSMLPLHACGHCSFLVHPGGDAAMRMGLLEAIATISSFLVSFLPQSSDMQPRLNGISKFPIEV